MTITFWQTFDCDNGHPRLGIGYSTEDIPPLYKPALSFTKLTSTMTDSSSPTKGSKLSVVVRLALFSAALLVATTVSLFQQQQSSSFPSHRRLLGEDGWDLQATLNLHLPMFQTANFKALGPSSFPKPTNMAKAGNGEEIVPYLKPTFGTHRNDQDSVFLFAAEYPLATYVLFLATLRATGYDGDVVVAISKHDYGDEQIRQYLQDDPHLIAYVIEYTCFNAENEAVDSVKGGMRVCQAHNLYGRHGKDATIKPILDPRPPRTVPTTRYEIYWIWAQYYSKHSWIMLIDARDTAFQSNPFEQVPRDLTDRDSGVLFFFGENIEATRIGQSKKNRKWLTTSYGETVVKSVEHKPTICSGSTMGEQVALEQYLRAMVSESDETGTKLMGADQGFHNYLYYSGKLENAKGIRSITVQDQGSAIINNLGAMRTKELDQWGNGKLVEEQKDGVVRVLNWDGRVSPVVHQFDRHQLLSTYWYKKQGPMFVNKWKQSKRK